MKTKKEYQAIYEKGLDARNRWAREHTEAVHIRFNVETDADILDWLAKQPNKTDYIRRLIRKDIEEERE